MDKTRIYLYSLDNPILIVPAKTGIVYYNQVNGCACEQKEQEGYIILLPKLDPMEHTCFNPLVWYDRAHSSIFIPRNIREKTADKIFEAYGWKETKMSIQQATAYAMNSEAEMWFNDVIEQIEMMDREFGMQIRVLRRERQMEAWFQVRFFDTSGFDNSQKKWKRAILTWGNSD